MSEAITPERATEILNILNVTAMAVKASERPGKGALNADLRLRRTWYARAFEIMTGRPPTDAELDEMGV